MNTVQSALRNKNWFSAVKVKQQKYVSSAGTWRCRVCLTQWGWMANCSRCTEQQQRRPDHSPIVEQHNDGVTRADVDAERSHLLVSVSTTRHSSFARYNGAVPCRQRKTSTASLNSIRSRTGNQWRSRSSSVMCSYSHIEQTSRAVAFITDCSLFSWFPGRPASVAWP